jgi:hypothetical protein
MEQTLENLEYTGIYDKLIKIHGEIVGSYDWAHSWIENKGNVLLMGPRYFVLFSIEKKKIEYKLRGDNLWKTWNL